MRINIPYEDVIVKPVIHNVYILDSSGSMSGMKYQNAKEGIFQELDILSQDKNVVYKHTLLEFSKESCYRYRVETNTSAIRNILLRCTNLGQDTALSAAIKRVIVDMQDLKKPEEKVLIKIFTDGDNNVYDPPYDEVKRLISGSIEKGFAVTFSGTEDDLARATQLYGLDSSNTKVHKNTPESVKETFMRSAHATVSYAANVSRGFSNEQLAKGFYDNDRD